MFRAKHRPWPSAVPPRPSAVHRPSSVRRLTVSLHMSHFSKETAAQDPPFACRFPTLPLPPCRARRSVRGHLSGQSETPPPPPPPAASQRGATAIARPPSPLCPRRWSSHTPLSSQERRVNARSAEGRTLGGEVSPTRAYCLTSMLSHGPSSVPPKLVSNRPPSARHLPAVPG